MRRAMMKRAARFAAVAALALAASWASGRGAAAQTALQPPLEHRAMTASTTTADVSQAPKTEGTEVAGEGGAPGPIHWFDTQILRNTQPPYLALLFNFVLLLLLYYWLFRKPAMAALKGRRDRIAKEIERAALILKEAKDRARRYRAKLDKVKDDAAEAKQSLAFAGKGDATQILRNAEEKAARIQRDAEFLLAQEGKQVHGDLLRETVEKAARDAEALLKKSVTAEDQERLAQAFLDQLSRDYAEGSLQ